MKLASIAGCAHVVANGRLVDIESASGGELSSDPMAHIGSLGALAELPIPADAPAAEGAAFEAPVPRPPKVLAVGLNYGRHAQETGFDIPEEPVVFGKFPNAICGPTDSIVIPPETEEIDWEVELVVVIGKRGAQIAAADAWSHVAGFTCGQDISDRAEQFRAAKQFTYAKSYDTFAPIGPYVVTLDELENPEDLRVVTTIDGVAMQNSRTTDFIFSIPEVIEWLTRYLTLEVGDLIFTGTPEGVGMALDPPRYLAPGMVVGTEIEGLGSMLNTCV